MKEGKLLSGDSLDPISSPLRPLIHMYLGHVLSASCHGVKFISIIITVTIVDSFRHAWKHESHICCREADLHMEAQS